MAPLKKQSETDAKTETKVENKNENKIPETVRKKIEEIVEKSRENESWESVDIMSVDGETTSMILTLSVNAKQGAVMFTIHTPKLANKPNMIKLPTLEHLRLICELVDKMKQKLDKLEEIYTYTCRLVGTSENRRVRRPRRETLEI